MWTSVHGLLGSALVFGVWYPSSKNGNLLSTKKYSIFIINSIVSSYCLVEKNFQKYNLLMVSLAFILNELISEVVKNIQCLAENVLDMDFIDGLHTLNDI